MCAAEEGHFLIVSTLLQHGADINATDCNKFTALMKAAKNGRWEIVTFLLDQGAYVNATDCQHFLIQMRAAVVPSLKDIEVIQAAGGTVQPNQVHN